MSRDLSDTERWLLRAAETKAWNEDLAEMFRLALRARDVRVRQFDTVGDMADALRLAAGEET